MVMGFDGNDCAAAGWISTVRKTVLRTTRKLRMASLHRFSCGETVGERLHQAARAR
jgi:hypothetical protein